MSHLEATMKSSVSIDIRLMYLDLTERKPYHGGTMPTSPWIPAEPQTTDDRQVPLFSYTDVTALIETGKRLQTG